MIDARQLPRSTVVPGKDCSVPFIYYKINPRKKTPLCANADQEIRIELICILHCAVNLQTRHQKSDIIVSTP